MSFDTHMQCQFYKLLLQFDELLLLLRDNIVRPDFAIIGSPANNVDDFNQVGINVRRFRIISLIFALTTYNKLVCLFHYDRDRDGETF